MSERMTAEELRAQSESLTACQAEVEAPARRRGPLRLVDTPESITAGFKEAASFVETELREGVDYGVVPGTGDKPALLKPGAEKLCSAFDMTPRFEVIEASGDPFAEVPWTKSRRDWRSGATTETSGTSYGLFRYVVRCCLHDRESGTLLGEGLGSCSSLEKKYIDRPREMDNTLLKQAKKRAFVDAVLTVTALSGAFTQDVEELRGEGDEGAAAPKGRGGGRQRGGGSGGGGARNDSRGGGVGETIATWVKAYRDVDDGSGFDGLEDGWPAAAAELTDAQREPVEKQRAEASERVGRPLREVS